jgi:hypothetical protein
LVEDRELKERSSWACCELREALEDDEDEAMVKVWSGAGAGEYGLVYISAQVKCSEVALCWYLGGARRAEDRRS